METTNKIYARNVHYNAVLMMNSIYKIISKRGGCVVTSWDSKAKYTDVHNREVNGMPVVRTPFWGASTCYIKFHYLNHVYYLEFPSNIFDNIICGKVSVVNDQANRCLVANTKYYCDTIAGSSKIIDELYGLKKLDMKTINRLAETVWNTVVNMKPSPYIATEKREVPNTYNSGYHTEEVPVKCRVKYHRVEINM